MLTKANPDTAGQLLEAFVRGVKTHGVPYTVTAQARSALRLGVALAQQSRLPGTSGRVLATLTDSGIPLIGAAVHAVVTDPDGSERTIRLRPTEPGRYAANITTTTPGVYRILARAKGADLRGTRFTREELRTLAVWAPYAASSPSTRSTPTGSPSASSKPAGEGCDTDDCTAGKPGFGPPTRTRGSESWAGFNIKATSSSDAVELEFRLGTTGRTGRDRVVAVSHSWSPHGGRMVCGLRCRRSGSCDDARAGRRRDAGGGGQHMGHLLHGPRSQVWSRQWQRLL